MKRSRPGFLAAALAAAAALPTAGPARASWDPPSRIPTTGPASQVSAAVSGRGSTAVGWVEQRGRTTRIRVAVRAAGGPLRTRTVMAARDRAVWGPATVLDTRGELTVAWVDRQSSRGLLSGPITLRAAYRTPSGRWSAAQPVSRMSAFAYAEPRLAAAPDGTVALTFNAGVRAAPGVGAAWRRPGHAFGRVQRLTTAPRAYLFEPTLTFDRTGRAYLAGTRRCDGTLFVAPPGRRRFGAVRVVAPRPANHLRFVLTGPGAAALAWIRSECSLTEDLSGPLAATVLHGTRTGAPVTVTPDASTALGLSGAPGGAAELSFTRFAAEAPGGEALVARLRADGTTTAPAAPSDGWAAVVADAADNQLVVPPRPANTGPPAAIAARPANGSPVAPAPLAGDAFYATASAPFGAALVAARPGPFTLAFSVWRPGTV